MERDSDHSQKILLAVEFATAPRTLPGKLPGYAIFQRMGIPEVVRAFDENESLFVRLLAARKFASVLNQHMGYWEKRVPPTSGATCITPSAATRSSRRPSSSSRVPSEVGC